MPRKRQIEDKLTRTRAEEELSPWLLKLMGDRALPLAPRSLIHVPLPPLALYVRQQLDYLRQEGWRLTAWVTDHAGLGLTPLRAARLPILLPAFIPILSKPTFPSPVWWQLLNLTWFRRRRKRKNEPIQRAYVTDEEQLINDTNLWADELPQTLSATEEEANAVDELYPMVTRSMPSPPMARTGLPDITDDFSPLTDAILVPLQVKPVADESEIKDGGRSTMLHISQRKIPGHYQANQIQGTNRWRVKDVKDSPAQANWQPEPAYSSRWSGKVWAPLTEYITRLPHLSYLMITRARAGHTSQAVQHPTLPYIDNTTEAITRGQETIATVESYYRRGNLEKKNLSYSLPDQSEPPILSVILKRPSLSAIPRETGSLNELVFNSLPHGKLTISENLGLLPVRANSQPAVEISQARRSAPLVSLFPEIVTRKAEATNIPENSGSMTRIPVTEVPLDKVSLGQSLRTDQTELPLIYRDPPSVVDSAYQPSSIAESIYQTPALPARRYFKSAGNTPPPEESENFGFLWNQDYEPSLLPDKETRQSVLEQLITSVATPGTGSNATHQEESLTAIFEGTAYYGSQVAPELALAPVGRSTEAVSPPPPKPEVKEIEDTNELAAPDIDAIARDVYCILKRRLAREKERALGLS